MESFLLHMAHAAIWFFVIIFILALIGIIAIVKWIVDLFHKTERAVEGGIHKVEDVVHHHDT